MGDGFTCVESHSSSRVNRVLASSRALLSLTFCILIMRKLHD